MRIGLIASLCIASSPALEAPSPVGTWKTIDDDTRKARSHVQIVEEVGQLKGRIVELIDPDEPNPKCTECSGKKKNQPIKGLEIMWGLEKDGPAEWSGGKVLDPENGKTYDCKVWLESADVLKVRGSWLFIGRTQTWYRVDQPNDDSGPAGASKD